MQQEWLVQQMAALLQLPPLPSFTPASPEAEGSLMEDYIAAEGWERSVRKPGAWEIETNCCTGRPARQKGESLPPYQAADTCDKLWCGENNELNLPLAPGKE